MAKLLRSWNKQTKECKQVAEVKEVRQKKIMPRYNRHEMDIWKRASMPPVIVWVGVLVPADERSTGTCQR